MNFQYSPYGTVLMISAIIVLSLAVYSNRERSSNLHTYFLFLMLSVFFWCLGASMDFFSIAAWAKIFWVKISYLGVATAAPLWFIFVLNYVNFAVQEAKLSSTPKFQKSLENLQFSKAVGSSASWLQIRDLQTSIFGILSEYLKHSYIGLIFAIPLIVLIMALTNEWHGLLWPSIVPISNQPGALLIYEHGPVFWVNTIYSFVLILTGIILLIRMFIDSSIQYRYQISILILVGLVPLIFGIIYANHIIPIPGLDFTPFALTISGILLAISIFKFQFLDIIPVAHEILFKSMINGVLVFDDNEKLIEVNSAAGLMGISPDDVGKGVDDILGKFKELKSIYKTHKSESEIFLGEPANRWVQMQITPIYDDKNIFKGHLLIIQDINKRKTLEKELEKSLEEKELMMKEIHHRVKNNLMIIQSLLQLQSRYINDENVLNIFRESQSRIRSMALIHQRLYQHNLKTIDFGDYPRTLALDIFKSYASDPDQIKLNVYADNVMLNIDTAIPLGLILNELVSNSLKYAFPEGRKGQLTVEFKLEDNKYKLIISDDGIGIPEELNYKNSDSLGLKLVYSLSDQIGAEVKLDTTNGTRFEITFDKDD